MEDGSVEEHLNNKTSSDTSSGEDEKENTSTAKDEKINTSPALDEKENISSVKDEKVNSPSAENWKVNTSSAEDEKMNTSFAVNGKDQEEFETTPGIGLGGDFHINATLPSLKQAVRNGLLKDAFGEGEDVSETSDDDKEAFRIANKGRKMLRKNLLATSNRPICKKLVQNSAL